MSEPYDHPGGAPFGNPNPNDKTQKVKNDLSKAVGLMQGNIKEVATRGDNFESLQNKTDTLAASSQGFRRGANKVRKDMWWKEMKMKILIGVGILILLLIIIVPIVVKNK